MSTTLPDYTKLPVILNQSGIQDSNPPLYQVIKSLCDALQFAQIALTSGNIGLINTLPLGALVGDGSILNALGVNVDGTTVTINASNQLVANTGTGAINIFFTSLNTTQIKNLNSTPQVVMPGVGSKVAVPVWTLIHGTSGPVAPGTPATNLYWVPGSGFTITNFSTAPWPGGGAGSDVWSFSVFNGGHLTSAGTPIGKSVFIQNSVDEVGVGLIYSGGIWVGGTYV